MIRAIIDIKVKIYSPSRMLFERRLVNYGTTADDDEGRSRLGVDGQNQSTF
jgi:hypothetical protein